MAFTSVGTGGSGINATSSTSFSFNASPAATITGTNRFAILVVTCDNTTTTDSVSNDVTTVTNTRGGTWTKLDEYTNGNGAAAAGVTTAVFLYVPAAAGELRSGDPVTINFASARVEKAASLWVFGKDATGVITLETAGIDNGVDAVAGFGSVAYTGLTNIERLYFRGMGKEANTTTQITPTTSFTAITANRSSATANAIAVRGEFRIFTGTGLTSNPTLADVGDTSSVFLALLEGIPRTLPQATRFNNTNTFFAATLTQNGGATSLTQSARFDDGDTFYAATVTTGAVDLAPDRFDNTNNFFAATVSQGGNQQDLTAGLYTNSSTFYAATLTAGAVNLTQNTRFDNASVFNAAALTVGPVTLTQNTRLNNSSVFNAATLTVGPVTLSQGARFDNLATFYPATLSAGGTALTQNTRFDNLSAFYAATLTVGAVNLVQNLRLDNSQTFYAASITQGTVLSAGLLTNTQTFYAASLTSTAFILPSLYSDGDTFFAATVTQSNFSQTLTANTFVNSNTFFGASVSGGEQVINNGGVGVGPRIRPFKKTILWDFDKPEKEEETIDAVTFVVTASAKASVTKVAAFGEINGEARIDYVQAEADVFAIEARSSWNDPTDEELISIISMAI